MSPKLIFYFALVAGFATFASADLFGDFLSWDLVGALSGEEKNVAAGQRDDEEGTSTCECEGQGCNCCVDFNLTSIIDLGGPGCVRMRYISQDEGVALNVSYGDSLLHSQTVKQKDRKGSCMNLLSELAQICARFAALKATEDGLEGCLHFEPHVLGEVTAKYHIGCFKMGPDGMVQDEKLAEVQEAEEDKEVEKPSTSETEEEEEEDDGTPSSIMEVVNQSAEQGLAYFSELLGIKVPGKKNKTTTAKPAEEATEAPEAAEDSEESRKFQPARTRLGRLHLANDIV